MKNYKVYTQESYGAEKFYIEDHEEQAIIFEADSVEDAIQQAQDYIFDCGLWDAESVEEWIMTQNWYAEEV